MFVNIKFSKRIFNKHSDKPFLCLLIETHHKFINITVIIKCINNSNCIYRLKIFNLLLIKIFSISGKPFQLIVNNRN